MEKKIIPTVISIAGPTASGKTALAIALAKQLGTVILSADSRQCYREMNIGVAKPSSAELAAVPHYFIDTHSIEEEVNAAVFERYALQVAEDTFRGSPWLVVAGGTGLYLKAFIEGLDDVPYIPAALREEIRQEYEARGFTWLQEVVGREDPLYYGDGEVRNPHRLMRALEVVRATGKSIRNFQRGESKERNFRTRSFAIDWPREMLYARIEKRVDDMMAAGLPAEVEGLYPHRMRPALQTVGYKELFAYLNGETTLSEAVALIKQHTRNYAKRQITWFKKDPSIEWLKPGEVPGL